jgi:hypothetical protein
MSIGKQQRQRKRSTRVRRTSRTSSTTDSFSSTPEGTALAREHYRREKARRAERTRPPDHPLEQARRAYQALLAADAERARGGRPRKGITTGKSKRPPSAEAGKIEE